MPDMDNYVLLKDLVMDDYVVLLSSTQRPIHFKINRLAGEAAVWGVQLSVCGKMQSYANEYSE